MNILEAIALARRTPGSKIKRAQSDFRITIPDASKFGDYGFHSGNIALSTIIAEDWEVEVWCQHCGGTGFALLIGQDDKP